MKAIINGKIILTDWILEGYALLFSDKIIDLVPHKLVPADAQIIDAEGGYVSPGLIDLHVHGFNGHDVCGGTENDIRIIAEGLIENGVTAFLPTTMTVGLPTIRRALNACRLAMKKSESWRGSTVLGAHAEGPFINKLKKGAQNENDILAPDVDLIKEFSDVIRIVTLAPEVDTEDFSCIREIIRDTDVTVSMGHTNADYTTAVGATRAGVTHATHLFNAMSPLSHREPGTVGAALNTDVSCELIVDTYHVSPALYDTVWKLKGRKLCFITDCLSAGGLACGKHMLGSSEVTYDGKVCRLADGTIAGSVLRLNKGVWNAYKSSSIPLHECVNCASLNPATVLGIDARKGSLDAGKDADIIITDSEFNVRKTIIGGEIKYEI